MVLRQFKNTFTFQSTYEFQSKAKHFFYYSPFISFFPQKTELHFVTDINHSSPATIKLVPLLLGDCSFS